MLSCSYAKVGLCSAICCECGKAVTAMRSLLANKNFETHVGPAMKVIVAKLDELPCMSISDPAQVIMGMMVRP